MGFGRDPDDLLANPSRSPEAYTHFAQSMAMVIAKGLGKTIEKVTIKFEVAKATKDIPIPQRELRRCVKAGTVAASIMNGRHGPTALR